MKKKLNRIPIFFAVDDKYIPFLAVALQSIIDNSSSKNYYLCKILYTDITEENQEKIKKYERDNVNIEFVDLNYYIEELKDKLYTRDYFSKATYFRLFIPDLYPQYDKVLYLDVDIVALSDVANLYNINMGDNLVAAAPDDVIQTIEVFQEYVEKVVGVADYRDYFNAGVLVMNLDELRKFNFQEKFLYLLETVKFSVAQDQDYLNRLCKGRTKIIKNTWDRMPIGGDTVDRKKLHLIHYNLAFKPWHFEDILYKEYFWKYAKKTEFFDEIQKIKENYSDEEKFKDREADKALRALAQKESDCVGDDRKYKILRMLQSQETDKSKERLAIIEKIKKLEKEGKFDIDAEEDPPSIELTLDNVDYLKEKRYSKIKNRVANRMGEKFLDEIIRTNRLIIKEIKGIENLENMDSGAIITCNHFNPFDFFAVEKVFRLSGQIEKRKLYKVIREGNYTNFPGFYGFLFRNGDTLPLSSNKRTMIEFMKSVKTILEREDFILIYPEQSLWWNYKKPKPLKNGAFKLAAKNNVPVLPIFITMEDSDIIGEDGFPVQQYIVNIDKPIYPDENISEKENTEIMKEENYQVWKRIYEDFYKIPLEYNCDKDTLENIS